MTICKQLASATDGKITVEAYEERDKHTNFNVPEYFIAIVRDGIAYSVRKAARTTWRKAYKNAVVETFGEEAATK